MPHKRAKRSIREAEIAKRGKNLPPSSSSYNDTPKGAARIINAFAVQKAFRDAGRTSSEDTGERRKKKGESSSSGSRPASASASNLASAPSAKGKEKAAPPPIKPNETLGEYNRRVEALFRPGVSSAIKAAAAATATSDPAHARRQKRKAAAAALRAEQEEGDEDVPLQPDRPAKEFAKLDQRKRVGDVAMAPPMLKKRKGQEEARANWGAVGKGGVPLNAGQKRILDEERERVIRMYRELKEERAKGVTATK